MSEPIYVLGPCAVETEDEFLATAREIAALMDGRLWWYKASYRKANRTANDAPTGPGLYRYQQWVEKARAEIPGLRFLTDVHEVAQVGALAEVFDVDHDVVQVPAFLARQTALLRECGHRFRLVNVKKMQSMSPRSARYIRAKVMDGPARCEEVWVTERGVAFGYETLLPDFGAVPALKSAFHRVLLDCGHSTQRMDPMETTKGSRDLAGRYFTAAPIFGYDGVYQEVHRAPSTAISDRSMQLSIEELRHSLRLQDLARPCAS